MRPRVARGALGLSLGGGCVWSLYQSGERHGGYTILCEGVTFIPAGELIFDLWYLLWGSLAVAFWTLACVELGASEVALRWARALLSRPRVALTAASGLFFVSALLFRKLILLDQPIADDELTYAFVMRTLLNGRVTNPIPIEPDFLANQFVLLNERGWFGKYPIGHPLVLALGRLSKLDALIVPVLGVGSLWLTFALGRRCIGERRALMGTLLLACSLQYGWTHATLLSQPSSCFFMLLGAWLTLRVQESRALRWRLGAALAWGLGLLTRPMPLALMLAPAVLEHVRYGVRARIPRLRIVSDLAVAGGGVLLAALITVAINRAQSGNPLTTAYEASHGNYGTFHNTRGAIATSLGGALIRQNFWLFGWPLSALFVPFARLRDHRLLFWGLIAADYLYRVLVPKTVVSVTGPVYVFESVPLLCLATADGFCRVADLLARLEVPQPRAWVSGVALASWLTAVCGFVPVNLATLLRGAAAREQAFAAIDGLPGSRRVVFLAELVSIPLKRTWAYHPPSPSPDLSDDTLYLRLPRGPDGAQRAWQTWQKHFPGRTAAIFVPGPGTMNQLYPLRAEKPPALGEPGRALGGGTSATP